LTLLNTFSKVILRIDPIVENVHQISLTEGKGSNCKGNNR